MLVEEGWVLVLLVVNDDHLLNNNLYAKLVLN